MASLMETRRRIMLNTPHLETLTEPLVSFDTDVPADLKEHKLYIEPIQDLHGYDHPWPAGGGKNKIPLIVESIKAANSARTWSGNTCTFNDVTFSILTDEAENVIGIKANGKATANSGFYAAKFILEPGTYIITGSPSGGGSTTYRQTVTTTNYDMLATDNGNGATFTLNESQTIYVFCDVRNDYSASNIVFHPMLRLASEADDSFAPYSNICPISGRTGVEVVRCGKNLLKNTLITVTHNGVNFTVNNDGTMLLSGTAIGTAQKSINQNLQLYAGTYILTGMASGGSSVTRMLYINDGSKIIARDNGKGATFTLSEKKIISVLCWVADGTEVDDLQINPMIRKADVIDDVFEPYQGETYDITFPSEAGTVYGGTLDLLTGELVVDRAIVDLGTLNWNYETNNSRFRTSSTVSGIKARTSSAQSVEGLACSIYEANPAPITGASKDMTIASVNAYLYIRDSRYTDAIAYKTAMSGVQLCYELATPITYQLTSHTLKALRGVNNIWSDTSVNTQVRFWTHKKED